MLHAAMLDLGDTLIHLDKPWDEVFPTDLEALYAYLQSCGLQAQYTKFARRFIREFEAASAVSGFFRIEIPMQDIMRKTAKGLKFKDLDDSLVQNAMEEFYRPEMNSWCLYPDTIQTLAAIRDHGLAMGLVSNAKSDWFVREMLRIHELDKFFKVIVSSADVRIRKPRADIFLRALKTLKIGPREAVFIGDSLQADILGAKLIGMKSIHLNRKPEPKDPEFVYPDATVGTLTEAFVSILAWSNGSQS